MTILFVCRGNAFRSVIAKSYAQSLQVPSITITSAGTVAKSYKQQNIETFDVTKQVLREHGLADYIPQDYANSLTQQQIDNADVIVLLNNVVLQEAKASFTLPTTTEVWNITDVGEGTRIAHSRDERVAYSRIVYSEIAPLVDQLITRMTPKS